MKCSYDQRPNCNTMSVLFAHVSQLTHLHFCMVYVLICPTTWADCSLLLFFEWGREKALPESHQAFKVTTAQPSGLINYFLSCQTGFFKWKHLLIYKPMVKTKPAVSGTWLLGLGSKLLIIPSCSRCSTKTLLNSCRVFLEYVKIEQAKERFFW